VCVCVCAGEHASTLLTSFTDADRRWNTRWNQTIYHLWPTLRASRAHGALKQHSKRQRKTRALNTITTARTAAAAATTTLLLNYPWHLGSVVKRGCC